MKGPITGVEVRYRLYGSEASSGYIYKRFPLDAPIELPGLTPGMEYDCGLRFLGPVPSDWSVFFHTVAANHRMGTLALPPSIVGNVGSRWISGATATWTATDTLATVDVSGGGLQVSGDTIVYGASSVQVSGVASEVKTVHLYYDDPRWEGGTRTLGYHEDITQTSAAYGRIYIASLQLTFDSAGGTGTSGGGGIGGGGGGSGTIEP